MKLPRHEGSWSDYLILVYPDHFIWIEEFVLPVDMGGREETVLQYRTEGMHVEDIVSSILLKLRLFSPLVQRYT